MTVPEQQFLSILKTSVHPGLSCMIESPDWTGIMNTARKQNLIPLIFDASQGLPGYEKIEEKYFEPVAAQVAQQAQKTADFLQLYNAFLADGLSPIVLKGIVCRNLYGDYADFRPSGDEDILVSKDDYVKVVQVINRCGYTTDDVPDNSLSTIQEITFHNPESKLTIELHLNPFGEDNQIRSKMNTWFRNSFSTTETLEVDGVNLRVLSPTANLLFLLFHAFKHFLSAGMGVRMSLDILLCIEKYQERIDWDYIKKALDDVSATAFTTDLIAVGNEHFGFDLKIDGLDSPISPEELLEDMLRMGTFGNGSQVDSDASRFTEAAIEGKRSNKIADTFHLIFPSWSQWKGFKPYLVDKPWMLPIEWFKRVGRYLKKKDKVDFSESRKIAERRIELLKKYKII